MKGVFLTAAFLFVLTTTAQATIFCEVLKTPDGFVALRSGPSVKATLLRKLKTAESVQVGLRKKGLGKKSSTIKRRKQMLMQNL
jgi:hypothetical protein